MHTSLLRAFWDGMYTHGEIIHKLVGRVIDIFVFAAHQYGLLFESNW